MDQRSDFGFGFAMGVVAGVATTLLMGAAFVFVTRLDWLREWQTLATGFLALGAAIPTVYYLHRQIAQQQELAERTRMRELSAARAMLPSALSKICSYAADCADQLRRYCAPPTDAVAPIPIVVPPVPVEELPVLRDCVKHGGDDLRDAVAELLSRLQIQSARIIGFAALDIAPRWHQFANGVAGEFLIDALDLHARASILFDYARGRTAQVRARPSARDMHDAAKVMGLHDGDVPEVYAAIERRYQ